MIRLDFVLPEWTRIIWNSLDTKTVWESKISRISNAFLHIEKHTVLDGIKPAWLTSLPESEVQKINSELAGTEFELVCLNKMPVHGSYSSSSKPYVEGQPYNYRAVLTKKSQVSDWKQAWQTSDNVKIGKLLGFPDCCIAFFQKYWIEENFVDTSWPMSLSGTQGPKECNILLRWLGIRAVSHLPCSFDCKDTYQIARTNIEWGYQNGLAQEMEWLEEMLDWPVQWSALHGIAEIRTPILKISTRTDATGDLVEVNKPGYSYPAEGSSGVKFPYINKAKTIVTKTNAFKRSILLENQWRDNGFSTFEAMSHSHQVLLKSLETLDTSQFYNIMDFGCGNAELLKSIQQRVLKNSKIHGVELDSDRYSRIKYNVTDLNTGEFYNQNMFDSEANWWSESYDLIILMPGRLAECSQEHRENFLNWIRNKSKWILLYAYGDWVAKYNQGQVDEPWKTLKSLGLEFHRINHMSTENCFASVSQIQIKKPEATPFQILG